MPYQRHAFIDTPPDETVLWRYLSFAKFMDLIEHKKLWFSRVDKFEDPLEGTYTDAELFEFARPGLSGSPPPDPDPISVLNDLAPIVHFVSCWRAGDHESMAMWDLYGKGEGTVAIRSTVGKLKKALESESDFIFVGDAKYVPWNAEKAHPSIDPISICFRKDESYRHEAEVRAAIFGAKFLGIELGKRNEGDTMKEIKERIPPGIALDFDPARFVTDVVVGPREQARLADLVKAILKRYGLPQDVIVSNRLRRRFGSQ
jgi:hypothetical protein